MLRFEDLLRSLKMDQALSGTPRDGCFGSFDNHCAASSGARQEEIKIPPYALPLSGRFMATLDPEHPNFIGPLDITRDPNYQI